MTPAPSIVVFVRHSQDCVHADKGEFFKQCTCRKHLRWHHKNKLHRQKTGSRTWAGAERERKKVEAQWEDPEAAANAEAERTTLEQARALFLADKGVLNLTEHVMAKYRRELTRFVEFMAKRGKHFPAEIGLADLTEYRATWATTYPASITRATVQQRLKGFLRFCHDARFIDRVPRLSPIPTDDTLPTLPLTDAQYTALLAAIPKAFAHGNKTKRVRALVLLMRWSGLAITDAVTLERAKLLQEGTAYRVVTQRTKTGTDVSVPIPPDVAKEILSAPAKSARYFFWNGESKASSVVSQATGDFRLLFDTAGMPDGHSHQLRDTFACDLLTKGVGIEDVSKLLGHSSVKVTEKHYSAWVQSRQNRLDSVVTATWV
jgi:integrase/recombinase XerD